MREQRRWLYFIKDNNNCEYSNVWNNIYFLIGLSTLCGIHSAQCQIKQISMREKNSTKTIYIPQIHILEKRNGIIQQHKIVISAAYMIIYSGCIANIWNYMDLSNWGLSALYGSRNTYIEMQTYIWHSIYLGIQAK